MTLEQDIEQVRRAVSSTAHVLDGTSAAFEQILVRLRELETANEDRQQAAWEREEAKDVE